jgi:hypothetical protein
LGDNPAGLRVGGEALVQCFVPDTILEVALSETDRLLRREGMRRTDVLKCVSFDEEFTEEDDVPEFVKKDVNEARVSGKSRTGTFFSSEESPFQGEEQGTE